MIQVNRVMLTLAMKVWRPWKLNPDGSFTWRKRSDAIWCIEHHNAPLPARKAMHSQQGATWRSSDHPCTLDDFVFLQDNGMYAHIGTGAHFTARQINKMIFKDRSTWPTRLMGERIRPTSFFRRYGRIARAAEFNMARVALTHPQEADYAQQQAA